MDYAAEAFDQIQRMYDKNGFNDHQLHCVLRFDSAPNPELLREAVIASIEAIPILGTRYVEDAKPRWSSLEPGAFARAFLVAPTATAFEEFVTSPADEGVGPQVAVCVDGAGLGTVAIKLNHMVCDAAGFKEYLYLLCDIYSARQNNPAYRPPTIAGDRSMHDVLRRISVGAKLKSLVSRRREKNLIGRDSFPLGEGAEVRPFILTHKLDRERAAAIKRYGRARGATVNDVVLTAFYRRLFKRLALRQGAELCVPLMVDMRRYLEKTWKFDALTNLTSMIATRLEHRSEEPFAGTLTRVKAIMDAQKKDHIGLREFVKADLVFRALGNRMANRLLKRKLTTPLICMTNIGILDSARLSFSGLRPKDAFLCGSIKYKPYFQLAASTYEGEMTLSANLRGSEDDRARIVSLFCEIDAELPGE